MPSDHRASQNTINSLSSAISTVHSFRTANENTKSLSVVEVRSTATADSTVADFTGTHDEKGSASSTLCNLSLKGDGEGSCKDLPSSKGEGSVEEEEWTFPDGGIKAWSVVFGCFMLAGAGMGYGLIWGSWLQDLHSTTYPNLSLATLNLISGVSNFFMTATAFVAGRLGDKYGYKRMVLIGVVCNFFSLVLSAMTFQYLPLIFIFQGFCIGVSGGIGMPMYLALPSQWFSRKRGLATGIAAAGSGFGGGLASLMIRALMPKLGYRYTMLIYAGINSVVWLCAFLLIGERIQPLKEGQVRVPKAWLPTGVWRDVAFYSLTASIAVGIWGYLTPYYYITAYTSVTVVPQIPSGSIETILPLVVSNFMGGFGRIFAGLLADKIGPVNTLFSSFFIGGLLQVILWPLAKSYGAIVAFGCLYGFFGCWFISILPVCAAQLFGLKGLATITGFVILCNSPGQFAGATVSGLVLDATKSYPALAYFSGSMMTMAAFVLLPARFSREKRIFVKY